jgi:hypothetical protein
MLKHYLQVAFRHLRKYKVQNVIRITGLATGFIVFAVCCFIVQFVLSLNRAFPDHERMCRFHTRLYFNSVRGDMYATLAEFTWIEKITAKNWPRYLDEITVNGKKTMHRLALVEADTAFIDFFSLQIVAGNRHSILQTPNSIVLYESKTRIPGEPDMQPGAQIMVDGQDYTLTGILKDPPANVSIPLEDGCLFNVPGGYFGKKHDTWNPRTGLTVFVLLREGVSRKEAQAALDAYPFVYEAEGDAQMAKDLYLQPVDEEGKKAWPMLAMLFAIGLAVLLVALFNFVSFQTAQFYNRLKECAVRKVNGAGKGQLLLSSFLEMTVVFVLAWILGRIVLEILVPVIGHSRFAKMLNPEIIAGVRMQLLYSTLAGLGLAFLMCLGTVGVIHRASIRVVLLGLSERINRGRGRKALLFVQMLILLAFLSTSLIIRLQVNRVQESVWHTLPADAQEHILVMLTPKSLLPNLPDVMQRLKASPSVEDVFFNSYPLYTYGSTQVANTGQEGEDKVPCRAYMVDENFPDFFNIKVTAGHFPTRADVPDAVAVDELFAAMYPDGNPLGMTLNGRPIVGVLEYVQMVKENKQYTQEKRPVFYGLDDLKRQGNIHIRVLPGRVREARQELKKTLDAFLPESFEPEVTSFRRRVSADMFDQEMTAAFFTTVFSAVCLILCLLGIYSAITMSTEKRRREVAIRKINGARIRDIIRLFARTYLRLWSAACLLLFPVIWLFGNRWLASFNQRITLDVFFFAGIYLSILALIFLMLIFRIMEVARCNPADVVKNE